MSGRGLKTGSVSHEILTEIFGILDATLFLPRKMTEITRIRFLQHYPIHKKYIYDLKRRNYIKEINTKNGKKIQLTEKGKLEIIKYKIKSKKNKIKWDGKWRAICWDVPEGSRKERDYLRRALRWVGFKEVQKSFWIFPFEVKDQIKELIRLYKEDLKGDVRFLTIEKLEKDSDLRKYFNL
ncbi:MAG: hypothetical protein COU70_00810 [Parcubacteria group bacterium CG10_big_fil_rev_8_21_14_0_10_35_15]|nr:MAG: hypothetical protein COU70_00810 [Parcubacteria group bacterium CG10_big_fil_rev_8_21_14_0_10_35_15]